MGLVTFVRWKLVEHFLGRQWKPALALSNPLKLQESISRPHSHLFPTCRVNSEYEKEDDDGQMGDEACRIHVEWWPSLHDKNQIESLWNGEEGPYYGNIWSKVITLQAKNLYMLLIIFGHFKYSILLEGVVFSVNFLNFAEAALVVLKFAIFMYPILQCQFILQDFRPL